eukprot:901130_1
MATNYHQHIDLKAVARSMTIANPISNPASELNTIKDGFLSKESQFMKISRKRWIVLTPKYLYSYKTKTAINPTVMIDLTEWNKIRHDGQKKFELISNDKKQKTRTFIAETNAEMLYWFNTIQNMQCFRNMERIRNYLAN